MIFAHPAELKQRISEVTTQKPLTKVKVVEDTSDFMSIDPGDVVRIGGNDYLITGYAREGRFGIDEQPKYWVRKAIDLTTGGKKIIKMVFQETFDANIGERVFHCFRSPEKEAEIIEKMYAHPNFMHGQSVPDAAGNLVRIIEYISGPSLYTYLRRQRLSHEEYFYQKFLDIMQQVLASIEGIRILHDMGLHHGDIRADHLLIQRGTDNLVWIDFDFEISDTQYDIYCLGNILQQVVGKGRHSLHDIRIQPAEYPDFSDTLTINDMSLMFRHRVANLRKLYPYIPEELNDIMMRFSTESKARYETVASLVDDLRCLYPPELC